MAVVSELIRSEGNGSISFGDYTLAAKSKLDNFEHSGDMYKVKTFKEITKLEKNGMFVYESVPGTTVTDFQAEGSGVKFAVEGPEDAEITVGLEEETEYEVSVNGVSAGIVKTNLGGKLTISVELEADKKADVAIARK